LLDRPVKKQTIPLLWLFTVLFVGAAIIMVQMQMPNDLYPSQFIMILVFSIIEFVTNRAVLGALLLSAIIVIIFLALKLSGKIM
jgi:prepilin signal peptidase PulO-like enzyme (type II secretory pathway)